MMIVYQLQSSIAARLYNLSQIDTLAERWREKWSSEMRAAIRNAIVQLQNPDDCKAAKKLICRLTAKRQGFGAAVQFMCTCLLFSMYLKRTMILVSNEWNYDSRGLNTY